MKFTFSAFATTAIVGLTAGAASAQDVSCGGIGAAGQWMGGAAEASDITTSEGPLTLEALPVTQGGNTVGYFSISETTEVRVEAQPVDGGDSVIELYDEAGTLILTDDDSGGAWASRAETTLQPGSYCLATRGYADGALTTDMRVGRLEHEDITQGLSGGFFGGGDPYFVGVDACTSDTQATLLGTGPIDGQLTDDGVTAINTISETPYYRFTLANPQAISVRAENPSADPYIYFFDGDGTLMAENDDYESLNSRIDFTTPLPAGTYCIGMRALSNPDVPVTLSVVGYDAAAALAELYDTGEAAPPLDGSYPVIDLGVLPGRSVRDAQVSGRQATWYAFEVPEQGALVVNAVEVTDSDPLLILYDDLGQEVAYNDDHGGTLNSQITARVQAGRYILAVRQYSDNYQGIIRIATERYIPAP
ncbi:PPC domain-containing protein [Gymnodinialimonas ceratoperidinii]|uniref:PPC domain-containing protein n=1 Tax=Gymnodinialimonas ceratoperidinii TaxID=2856823 RepID=A0A8F6TT95_9RHOB|nr:pre-peptidase C-terminal domain-containing protein [Gymnodinialimonas ceratoperidinii]QXT38532.1 PPC domain-containing protein [Gymnodinialimonas ceratoperidinii]